MNAVQWQRVKSIFQDAFERDPTTLRSWLDAACGDDAEVRLEVERLVEAHASAGGFLDAPVGSPGTDVAGATDAASAASADAPSRIGNYRIIREIGRGGMGAVYLAERDDPGLRKTVAIKIVRGDSQMLLRRFRTETQILAGLEHPGIARLHDGGSTEHGLPYFVMEYVAGETILAYCDAHRLSIADRVRLFRRVCDAVQFAHQSLIVHRDLKPSNILVTADGEPKLLDFGIAKLLHPDAGGPRADETIEITRLLTPQYASPEHVRGQSVTTASDVYSLGVILYELLCGVRPYRIASQHSIAQIERAVCEEDPAAPSAVAPAHLRRALRGDLDNIVLKALKKDPRLRYATSAELAEDLRRYLEGFPVLAQRDRVAYRARKFVQRHRAGVAAGSLALAFLVVGLALTFWQARLARLERDRARAEAVKAQQMATFLSGVFQGANPLLAGGKTITARDLLDRATKSIRADLASNPDAEASLLLVMSDAYSELTAFDKCAELAEQALALRRLTAPHSLAVAEALDAVGRVQRRLGEAARGVSLLEESLALREELGRPDDLALAQTLIDLAIARSTIGRNEGRRPMLERAITILERAVPTSARLARAYNVLGASFYDDRDFDHARAAYVRSIAVYERTNEAESSEVAMPLLNLADILRMHGDYPAARQLVERTLPISERTYGKESQPVAYDLGRLGDLARAEGDLPRARELLERSLAMYAKVVPADYYETAEVWDFLGRTLMDAGQTADAIPAFERARRLTEHAHGPDHAEVAEILVHIGRARALVEGPAAGEPLLRRALAIQRRAVSTQSEAVVPTLTALADVNLRQHRTAEARSLLEEAVKLAAARLAPQQVDRVAAEAALRTLPR